EAARPSGWLLVRPERLVLGRDDCPAVWRGRVNICAFFGADHLLDISVAPDFTVRVRCRPGSIADVRSGDEVTIGIPVGAVWVIPEDDPSWLADAVTEGNHAVR